MKNGNEGVLRSFHLKITKGSDAKSLESFQRNTIFSGMSPGQTIVGMIKSFNRFSPKIKLATESEMVEALHKANLTSGTRQVLKTLRDSGMLNGPDGRRLWGTDGNSIIYDRDGVIKYFRQRRKGEAAAAV